ncbi:Core-2/I-Branching enzyme family protein [Brugia pahangi]
MKTEECRTKARNIVCNINQLIPDSLPNTCPKYDDKLRGYYMGCFKDSLNSRLLNGHYYIFRNNSPLYCVNMCLRAGYHFAAVEYHDECFCGDTLTNPVSLPNISCEQYHCNDNDNNLFCGGYNAAAIYRTGVIEKPLLVINYTKPDDSVPNVQILFLLQLNGRNIRQVNRLFRIIYSPKHYYIIHVDSRQQYMFEGMKELVATVQKAGYKNVYLMEKRYATIWAGAALLSMILEVLKTALYTLNWNSWDFMLNLSESNFPILSMVELEFHLANKGRIFLGNHGYDTARFIQKQGLEYVFMQCENRMWLLMKRTKFPNSIRFDGGSDWIVISRDFAEYALSDEELPLNFRKFFTNVLLPVETFFHTLAANSKFCMQVVKGNLHLTNWKRQQGCRCAALKKIVDWCGCSPLAFRSSDISKFSLEAVKNRVVFFGRKFDSMISQRAIAIAEAQALRFTDNINDSNFNHPSFNKSWTNVYLSQFDQSVLLENFARALLSYEMNGNCIFGNLSSIIAYKENDEANIQSIYRSSYRCNNNNNSNEFIQVLVESINLVKFMHTIVDGYELINLEIGTDFDFKEEIFRKYHNILSEDDTIYAKLRWRRIGSLATSVHQNFTSPEVIVEWKNPSNFVVKRTKVNSYNSMFGGQYTELFSNETTPGEWTVEFIHMEANISTVISSIKFIIFSITDRNISDDIIFKYFRRIDFCSEGGNINNLPNCLETSWSASFPDLKSHLFF